MTATSEVLNLAADLIEERGWRQGDGWVYSDQPATTLCLEGGIMAALGMSVPSEGREGTAFAPLLACPAYKAVSDYLELVPAGGDDHGGPFTTGQPLFWWNDTTGRTAADVVETLRACAVIEASRERETAEVSA